MFFYYGFNFSLTLITLVKGYNIPAFTFLNVFFMLLIPLFYTYYKLYKSIVENTVTQKAQNIT